MDADIKAIYVKMIINIQAILNVAENGAKHETITAIGEVNASSVLSRSSSTESISI